MKVTLTGSTGFVGSHILTESQDHGHEVTALVRDDAHAEKVATAGAIGTGQQHWSTVHAADLADFFRCALEDGSARGRYVIGNGSNATVAELTEAAAVAARAPGAVAGSDDEARARLGEYFAEVLLLDQGNDAAKARAELGWRPSRPVLADEFRHGSYRTNGGLSAGIGAWADR